MAREGVPAIADSVNVVDRVCDHNPPDSLTANAERIARQVSNAQLLPRGRVVGPLSHDRPPDCPLQA